MEKKMVLYKSTCDEAKRKNTLLLVISGKTQKNKQQITNFFMAKN